MKITWIDTISIIGSLSSIFSLLFSFLMTRQRDENSNSNSSPPKWPIVLIMLVTGLSFCLSVYCYVFNSDEIFGRWALVAFIISFGTLVIYAVRAYRSFDTNQILPPIRLWQVLFNKIPSHIRNANQLCFKFLVLKMENSPIVEEAAKKIENDYYGRPDFNVVVKSFEEEVPLTDDYCGVIFIVGEKCGESPKQEEVLSLMDEYSKHLLLPMAYILVGNNYYRFRKYHRISSSYLDQNCANHLIMRSYRRSEHWIQLSHLTYVALWVIIGLFVLSFTMAVVSFKKVEYNKNVIVQKDSSINELKTELNDFGADRNKIHLPNVNGKQTLPCNIDIEALQHDTYFREFLNGFAKYFFADTTPAHILLWLRNDKKNDLICIYDGSEKPDRNNPKGKGSMIWGIAKLNQSFVLWPGQKNEDKIWYSDTITLAWRNADESPYPYSKLFKKNNTNYNSYMVLKSTEESIPDTLWWQINTSTNDQDYALYGFSFDNRLIVELDFEFNKVNDIYIRNYLQHLEFRNNIRRFLACISSFIDIYNSTKNSLNNESQEN